MNKKDYSYAGLTLQVEVRVPVFLKVKAYTRVRFGKTFSVVPFIIIVHHFNPMEKVKGISVEMIANALEMSVEEIESL